MTRTLTDAASEELSAIGGVEIDRIPPAILLGLISLVQLGTRHPQCPETLREVAEAFVADMRASFAGFPALQALLDLGTP